MARLSRMVIPGVPHHVTQRGNRRERTFFEDGDYALYLDLLAEGTERAGVEIWSYCLMPNHVHVVAVPRDADGLGRAFRYVALNPVRARLTARPEDWNWSSTRAHFAREDDHVVRVAPALQRIGDFRAFLGEEFDEAFTYAALRKAETIGRPVGSPEWLADMSTRMGRPLAPGKRAPKSKQV